MRLQFREPTEADIEELAANMRALDRKECEIVTGLAPREALKQSVAESANALAAVIDGQVISIFGHSDASFLGEERYPWMISMTGIERYAREVIEGAPIMFEAMKGGAERLHNIVHADNRTAIRFIGWLGFSFGERFDLNGEPFLPFEWRRA